MFMHFQLRALIEKAHVTSKTKIFTCVMEPVLCTEFQMHINVIAGSSLENNLTTKISKTHPKNRGTLFCYFVLSQLFRYSSQTKPSFYYVIYI